METGTTRSELGNGEKAPLSSADWVNAAIDVVVDNGVSELKVERLAARLGVSKGSFYWHFKSRDDLLRQVLAEWARVATYDLEKRIDKDQPEPAQRLFRLMQLPLSSERAVRMADLELAIISFARQDSNARAALNEVDAARTAKIASLLQQIGIAAKQALQWSHEIYALIRYVSLRRDLPSSERLGLLVELHRRIVTSV
jgi:AcrR family transcriptional regulator